MCVRSICSLGCTHPPLWGLLPWPSSGTAAFLRVAAFVQMVPTPTLAVGVRNSKSGCAGRAWASTRQLQKAQLERLSPGKLLPAFLCVFVMWFAWECTGLIKLLFLAAVSDVSGTTSAPGDQDQAWEQDMGWEEWVGWFLDIGVDVLY